jgi:ADP-ribose diphosphatase
MKHWKTKNRRTLVKDRWISLHADECELPNGQVISPFYVMEEKEWVHIVALNPSGEILLTRQYRHAANVVCSELPCGAAEEGEEPLEAARRELKEETGYTADEWTKVAVLFANPARQTNRIHCFGVGAQSLDDSEQISFESLHRKPRLCVESSRVISVRPFMWLLISWRYPSRRGTHHHRNSEWLKTAELRR